MQGESTRQARPLSRTTAPAARRWTRARHALVSLLPAVVVFMSGCDVNAFDRTQVPRITVTPVVAAPLVVIAWQPAGAALVRVYRGTVAGQGYGPDLVWSIAATSGNSLVSGVEYGVAPPPGGVTDVSAQPLTPGAPYTVEVTRQDPKGSGGGFTNTRNRYVSTQTFTIAARLPAP